MIDPYSVSVILFFAILAAIIYKDRKNIDFKYILVMRRTKKFKKFIDSIAKISPKFWKILGTLGVIICFFYMIQGTVLLTVLQPQVQLVLPSLSSEVSISDVSINIPFWTWMIVIFFILVPHELAHGIMSRAEKIKLKSVGLMLLAIFPGAFVEPDEKQVKKSKMMTRLRIFAAGSFSNFIVSFIIFHFVLYILWPTFSLPGIILTEVVPESPAAMAGLQPGMLLTKINGQEITTTYTEYLNGTSYLSNEISEIKSGQIFEIWDSENKLYIAEMGYNETTERPYMGIIYRSRIVNDSEVVFLSIVQILTMISFFSLAVGIVNILPIYPLDGGLMIEAIADKYIKKHSKKIVKGITIFVLAILLYSFLKPFIVF